MLMKQCNKHHYEYSTNITTKLGTILLFYRSPEMTQMESCQLVWLYLNFFFIFDCGYVRISGKISVIHLELAVLYCFL